MPSIEQIFDSMNPLSFVLGFAVIWLLVSVLISKVGGWSQLANHYRSDTDYGGERWRLQNAAMRYRSKYSNILTVGVSPAGLSVSVLFLFRPGHPPLLIPWSDIKKTQSGGWFKGQELRFSRSPDIPMTFGNALIEKIEAARGQPIPSA